MEATDPLRHLACSHCRAPCSSSSCTAPSLNLPPAPQFSLAPCAHILCDTCTAQANTANPPACPACGERGHLVPLDQASPDLQACFRPLSDLAQDLGTAAGWQTAHLAEQLDYFKQKCADQKHLLARVGQELKKVKTLKQQVAQLTAENDSLRAELDSLSQQQHAQPPQHAQQLPSFFQSAGGPAPAQENRFSNDPPRGQKRKSRSSPDRASLPLRPATHASTRPASRSSGAGSIPSNLPQAPTRLSLTPAQQNQARKRTLMPLPEEGRDPQGGVQGEGSIKDKLAKFAYDPTRSTALRSSANTPAPSASRPSGRASAAPTAAQFRFNPPDPSLGSYQQFDNTYDPTPQLQHAHEQEMRYEDDEAQMPPPPVPVTRHAQQQYQQHQRAPFVSASTLLAQHAHAHPAEEQQRQPTPRPFSSFGHPTPSQHPPSGAPARAPSAGGPQPWSARPGASTHRRPFTSASALARSQDVGGGGVGGGGGAGGGR